MSIDRRALVSRHRVVMTEIDGRSPLSVGNGEFCFTVDVTGLQTFPDRYPVASRDGTADGTLLGTQAQWGWHSVPGDHRLEDTLITYDTPHGPAPYADVTGSIGAGGDRTHSPAELWLRANPHRLDLGRIGLELLDDGRARPVAPGDVSGVRQVLDLWHGVIDSTFELCGQPVRVLTVCHPTADVLAVRIESDAVRSGRLAVRLAFPYGSQSWHDAADWTRPEAHRTTLERTGGGWRIDRVLDADGYAVAVAATPGLTVEQAGPHELRATAGTARLDLVAAFAPSARSLPPAPGFDAVLAAAEAHWPAFWSGGGAVDLVGSTDERAAEIERRTVLSQYLTAINCAGSLPPQETGLVCNSWRGRFHLEMHWWHAAHFPLWGRPELLARSLRWYHSALDAARATAKAQGRAGARWPKQVGPDARESPSPIGAFLIWQQPHPIHLAELLYRAAPSREVIDEFAGIVFETAEFMASYAARTERGFQLGPPLVPAQESYGSLRARATNPTFELAYWQWALETAQRWRERAGLPRDERWSAVAGRLVRPHVRDGVYTAIDVDPYTIRTDHPSMLCALGFLPQTPLIDPPVMRATLHDVLADWDWDSTWGWDYPVIAMTAARLGEPELAVAALTMQVQKNEFLPNGHNRQTSSLPLYLPGNGGVLAAVALMAAGWDGAAGRPAPGFPDDGRWTVEAEGLVPAP
ncbi:hypothetical protein [Jiangella anatolica]|uniref:Glycoside hydrolase family 65 n=1 Tax=Jiangella anatolica TaxID=2670374 RepID=A0A2W2BDW3_9ACTN|nr:hypothetical protein [Jiangella anatolica]PZF85295.1 hypothetical protein C1I92_05475 [Jiangella anatolica]